MIEPKQTQQEKQTFRLFAQNIVITKGQQIFEQDKALSCLSKSEIFFKELLDIFNNLYYCDISFEKFCKIINEISISQIDKRRLLLCAQVYELYIKLMSENGFKIPYPKIKTKPHFENKNNIDIDKRLKILKSCFSDITSYSGTLNETNAIEYLEFSDIQSEITYVISEIDKAIKNGASYSDFAIFADKSEARRKILDILKSENIPVKSSIYNQNYENLKHKINSYQKISECCYKLKLKDFSAKSFQEIPENALEFGIAKSQKEILLEELDEITKHLLVETLSNCYTLDKIISKKEHTQKTLFETIFSSWASISETDKEQLTSEINSIKTFYNFYFQLDYAKAIESIIKKQFFLFENTELKDIVLGKIKSLNELQNLYNSVLKESPKFNAFQDILEWLPQEKKENNDFIKLSSISSDFEQNKAIKYVFILGLTENNFPGTNSSYPIISDKSNIICSSELKKLNSDFDYIVKTDEMFISQKLYDLAYVISQCSEKIVFSTHSYEQKTTVLPSAFFKTLVKYDKKNHKKISDEQITELQKNKASNIEFADSLSSLKINNKEDTVIKKDDTLKLNPSSINVFQQCPRKYYFKSLLNLKEPSNFAASYGSIVHSIFEVINKNFLKTYDKETALALAETLFNSKNSEEQVQKALNIGFSQVDVELIKSTDELSLIEMKENFKNAMDDYELMGYFANVPCKADCEKSFTFSIEELPNIIFDGRIDAICEYDNGELVVIDYKTGKNKENSLDYAISDYGVNFLSKTGRIPSNPKVLQNNFDYQIPIYYLACQNSKELSEYCDKTSSFGLLYIRPNTKHDGCSHDFVKTEQLAKYKNKIIKNLKTTIIDKITNETKFKSEKNWNCDFCSYKFLCDSEVENE